MVEFVVTSKCSKKVGFEDFSAKLSFKEKLDFDLWKLYARIDQTSNTGFYKQIPRNLGNSFRELIVWSLPPKNVEPDFYMIPNSGHPDSDFMILYVGTRVLEQ